VKPGRPARAGLLTVVLTANLLMAQGSPRVTEWGIHATLTTADSSRLGLVAGPRFAVRSLGGTRLALSLGAGVRGDRATGRGEAALEYLFSPRAARRLSIYGGGGLAGVVGSGEGGYLLVYLGVERSPGLPAGWAVEAGLGGGFRVRAAYHWRRFPPGWRARQ
jgi:hypothetical protein